MLIMTQKLKKKTFEPSVYSVIFFAGRGGYNHGIVVEYREEDAIAKARENAAKLNFPIDTIESTSAVRLTLREINQQVIDFSIEEKKIEAEMRIHPESAKSKLIRHIMESGDTNKIQQYRDQLSHAEVQYLEDQLTK